MWFKKRLSGSEGETYLFARGFDRSSFEIAELGFCDDKFTHIATNDWGYSHDELYIAGFLRGDGSARFVNRVTFPIYNTKGSIVAFSARAIGV